MVRVYIDDLHLIDEICNDAIFAGANVQYRFAVTFVATDTEGVQRIARQAILARAATDAKIAAKQNGVALGPLIEVRNERGWPNRKRVNWTATSAEATHAEPFEVLVSVTVRARWALVGEK